MRQTLRETNALRGLMAWLCVAASLALAAGCGPSVSERRQRDAQGLLGVVGESREVELPSDLTWMSVALDGGVIYAIGQDSGYSVNAARSLLAIDATTGEQRWRSDFDVPNTGMTLYSAELTAAGDVLLFRSEPMIVALSKRDGTMLWHIEDSTGLMRYVGAQNGTLYTLTAGNRVTAWSLTDGSELRSWDLQGYTFSSGGYGVGAAWLTLDGTQLVGVVDPSGGLGNETAVITLDLESASSSPQEIVRNPVNYNIQETMVGPSTLPTSSLVTYLRSNYVVKVAQGNDKTTLTGWLVDGGGGGAEPAWTYDLPVQLDEYGYVNNYYYYAPKVLLFDGRAVVQQPMSEGVLLRNVLRLHLHELDDFDRDWTNVLPTQHYISTAIPLPNDRVVMLTRNDSGNGERWYGFDLRSGELIWASPDQEFVGSTRAVASDGERLVRLTTVTQADSRLFIDDF